MAGSWQRHAEEQRGPPRRRERRIQVRGWSLAHGPPSGTERECRRDRDSGGESVHGMWGHSTVVKSGGGLGCLGGGGWG